MNPNTNELYKDFETAGFYGEALGDLKQVPKEHQKEASKLLGGSDSVKVPFSSKGGLATWALGKRKKSKAKRRMQKKSRNNNRR